MKRSKKVFLIISLVFFAGVLLVTFDISRKTTFPGSKKHLKESIMPSKEEPAGQEKKSSDSLKTEMSPKEN